MNRGAAVAAALAEPVRRKEIVSVYTAAVIQGVALVTFPAASVVFTSAADYGLTNQQYGGMFVPQAIMAVVSSLARRRLVAPPRRQARIPVGALRQSLWRWRCWCAVDS